MSNSLVLEGLGDTSSYATSVQYVDLGAQLQNQFAKSTDENGETQAVSKWTKVEKELEDGSKVSVLVRASMPVFRSGEFADSMGRRNKWTSMHINQMQTHFNLLSESGVFADIPIRRGHGSLFGDPMDSLIGYVTGLHVESRESPVNGESYDYLLADVEIIDEDAQRNISNGLWRNVSSEIGMMEDNDGAEYWPVFKGFAYVDIPAVEGLKEFSKAHAYSRTIITGGDMGNTTANVTGGSDKSDDSAQPKGPANFTQKPEAFKFELGLVKEKEGFTTSDYSQVQSYIKGLEGANKELADKVESLSEYKKSATERERNDYIDALAKENKIMQSQVDSMKEFAKGMTDDQFGSYRKMYDDAPQNDMFKDHAVDQQVPNSDHAKDEKEDRISVLKEIVQSHSLANRSEEFIKDTASYQELVKLDPNFSL